MDNGERAERKMKINEKDHVHQENAEKKPRQKEKDRIGRRETEEWRKNSVIIPVYDDSIIGFYDKGYGKAKDMPHQILITNVRVKKIQDISHEDCMLEGVKFCEDNQMYFVKGINEYELSDSTIWFHSPRDAFRSLINRINGDGTYENNPYAFIYNFKLIK